MPTAPQDTEITLGTGRMLVLFFTLVLVCAVFFAIGFSLGRKTTMVGASSPLNALAGTPATVVRPSAAKQPPPPAQPQQPQPTDFSFYRSVAAKSADTELAPQNKPAQPPTQNKADQPAAPAANDPTTAAAPTAVPAANSAPATGGYIVQVAAVSRQEDADALVEALKKKQYPAFVVNSVATDKFYHVQVGPYAEWKDADAMRNRLIADGYSPIVKK